MSISIKQLLDKIYSELKNRYEILQIIKLFNNLTKTK